LLELFVERGQDRLAIVSVLAGLFLVEAHDIAMFLDRHFLHFQR
jgi:hypothetical protein